jgi:hypothetical protein
MATEDTAPPATQETQEEGEDTTDSSPPRSYVSPGSSEHNEEKEGVTLSPELPIRDTIQISRQNSSDSDIAPPVHQFVAYPSNIYDSDGSDGRYDNP